MVIEAVRCDYSPSAQAPTAGSTSYGCASLRTPPPCPKHCRRWGPLLLCAATLRCRDHSPAHLQFSTTFIPQDPLRGPWRRGRRDVVVIIRGELAGDRRAGAGAVIVVVVGGGCQ